MKVPLLVFEIRNWQGFGDAQTWRLTHGRTQQKTVCLRHQRFSVVEAQKHIQRKLNLTKLELRLSAFYTTRTGNGSELCYSTRAHMGPVYLYDANVNGVRKRIGGGVGWTEDVSTRRWPVFWHITVWDVVQERLHDIQCDVFVIVCHCLHQTRRSIKRHRQMLRQQYPPASVIFVNEMAKTKMVKNEKITNSLTKTKTKTKNDEN